MQVIEILVQYLCFLIFTSLYYLTFYGAHILHFVMIDIIFK